MSALTFLTPAEARARLAELERAHPELQDAGRTSAELRAGAAEQARRGPSGSLRSSWGDVFGRCAPQLQEISQAPSLPPPYFHYDWELDLYT